MLPLGHNSLVTPTVSPPVAQQDKKGQQRQQKNSKRLSSPGRPHEVTKLTRETINTPRPRRTPATSCWYLHTQLLENTSLVGICTRIVGISTPCWYLHTQLLENTRRNFSTTLQKSRTEYKKHGLRAHTGQVVGVLRAKWLSPFQHIRYLRVQTQGERKQLKKSHNTKASRPRELGAVSWCSFDRPAKDSIYE